MCTIYTLYVTLFIYIVNYLLYSYLTHSYLFKGEPPPECVTCNCRLTISYILVDCIEYDFFRLILFENNFTLTDIFNNVSPNKIISFIKRAGLYTL